MYRTVLFMKTKINYALTYWALRIMKQFKIKTGRAPKVTLRPIFR